MNGDEEDDPKNSAVNDRAGVLLLAVLVSGACSVGLAAGRGVGVTGGLELALSARGIENGEEKNAYVLLWLWLPFCCWPCPRLIVSSIDGG